MPPDATHASTARPARRALLKSAAWSAPVLAVAVAAPLATASTTTECIDGAPAVAAINWVASGALASNWPGQTTTGWIGAFVGSPGGDATQNVTTLTDGFLSQDDNDSSTGVATVVVTTAIPVVAAAKFGFDIDASVGFGFPGGDTGSARQSVVVDVINPNGDVQLLLKLSVAHYANPAITPSDAAMEDDGYTLQPTWDGTKTYSLAFEATSSGTATIRYTFTIQPKIGANRSDDIALGMPLTLTQTCAV